ncbi:protein of unknown function [Pseudodesulfovibrio piezophilus C1TLV30]|uniref:Transposase n=1 Tax=Pseudodesulfovibrio piezophilus (strain DSM 21447 / JCM 15486 / C1TLV30) TaxID=1322246 RepID=M1WRU4_PSEP2|nr:protein of unknown function [Pseudodesulfovibrio piezophilus C1TLV30]
MVLDHMKQWKTARNLSLFLDELQTKTPDTLGLDEYIAWARDYAQAINPISHPKT